METLIPYCFSSEFYQIFKKEKKSLQVNLPQMLLVKEYKGKFPTNFMNSASPYQNQKRHKNPQNRAQYPHYLDVKIFI
jgi:hypothetical protein